MYQTGIFEDPKFHIRYDVTKISKDSFNFSCTPQCVMMLCYAPPTTQSLTDAMSNNYPFDCLFSTVAMVGLV